MRDVTNGALALTHATQQNENRKFVIVVGVVNFEEVSLYFLETFRNDLTLVIRPNDRNDIFSSITLFLASLSAYSCVIPLKNLGVFVGPSTLPPSNRSSVVRRPTTNFLVCSLDFLDSLTTLMITHIAAAALRGFICYRQITNGSQSIHHNCICLSNLIFSTATGQSVFDC